VSARDDRRPSICGTSHGVCSDRAAQPHPGSPAAPSVQAVLSIRPSGVLDEAHAGDGCSDSCLGPSARACWKRRLTTASRSSKPVTAPRAGRTAAHCEWLNRSGCDPAMGAPAGALHPERGSAPAGDVFMADRPAQPFSQIPRSRHFASSTACSGATDIVIERDEGAWRASKMLTMGLVSRRVGVCWD
jgi:hypothetical protein